jgi:electron transport complex protein RnfB
VSLTQRILDALPQTQCTRCGFPDCAAYAQAIAEDQTPINRCPPGGAQGVQRLAQATGRPVLPLDVAFGQEEPRQMAFIDEHWCIGCTLCIKACPVDAIIGSSKFMHTVLEAHCTGCELCIPACPVDCILLEDVGTKTGWAAWSPAQAAAARTRYASHAQRLDASAASSTAQSTTAPSAAPAPLPSPNDDGEAGRRAAVAAALARVRARQSAR